MKNYRVIKEGDRYTIAEWDAGYKACIINDGIYGYYWWSTEPAAQEAADALNAYDGQEWLGQHGYGNDIINESEIDDMDPEMVELYRLFGAIDYDDTDGKEAAFRSAIQDGNYEVRHEAECGCGFDWEIVGGQLRDTGESDYCWVGNILYVAGENVFQNIAGEPLESLIDLDVESILTDMDRYDILEDVTRLDENEESQEHLDRERASLVEWLKEAGYDLYIRYPRNFGNEYDCILAPQGREPEEDWEPQTPEQWASEYLRRPDAMTQVFRGFVLAE